MSTLPHEWIAAHDFVHRIVFGSIFHVNWIAFAPNWCPQWAIHCTYRAHSHECILCVYVYCKWKWSRNLKKKKKTHDQKRVVYQFVIFKQANGKWVKSHLKYLIHFQLQHAARTKRFWCPLFFYFILKYIYSEFSFVRYSNVTKWYWALSSNTVSVCVRKCV